MQLRVGTPRLSGALLESDISLLTHVAFLIAQKKEAKDVIAVMKAFIGTHKTKI